MTFSWRDALPVIGVLQWRDFIAAIETVVSTILISCSCSIESRLSNIAIAWVSQQKNE
jgi:hypothetical protein